MAKVVTRMLAATSLAVLIAGCAAAAPEPQAEPVSHDLTQADLDAVRAVWDEVLAAEAQADWDGVAALITDDIMHFDPRVGPLQGKAMWRDWIDEMQFGTSEAGNIYEAIEVAGSGDLAYIVWTLSGNWTEGDTEVSTEGKGITIFQRMADGGWMLSRNAWNPTPAADGGG